ncbi:MAG: hypothetical protein ACHQHN_19185 [Sphingobacteriales bacterium]
MKIPILLANFLLVIGLLHTRAHVNPIGMKRDETQLALFPGTSVGGQAVFRPAPTASVYSNMFRNNNDRGLFTKLAQLPDNVTNCGLRGAYFAGGVTDLSLDSITVCFIKRYHHLPELLSEVQISKNGLHLGEMNKLLAKNVEERTFYFIDKNEKESEQAVLLKNQQNEIHQLKQQVQLLI